MPTGRGALLLAVLLAAPGFGAAQTRHSGDAPMSAIDWLSQSVTAPVVQPAPPETAAPALPAVSAGAAPEAITVRPLGGSTPDTVGLVPATKAGLPHDLWGTSSTEALAALIRTERIDTLPAIQALLYTLLLAELDPPADTDGKGKLFLARVDKLLDLGALDPAYELLRSSGAREPESFRRMFDIALLIGEEDIACVEMRARPEIAPTFPARIFCLARGGDWNAAALSLRTGEALGYIPPEMAAILSRFLDPELYEGEPPLPPPSRPSPLVWRMLEAIGEPIPTATLPVAFAQADLRSNTGWKARIEAGERLLRMGAIDPNRLLGLYTERRAAASGGVWDRVAAIRRFDDALASGEMTAISLALPDAWRQMEAMELEEPFAQLYGERLAGLAFGPELAPLAFRIGLLSPAYEKVAAARAPANATERFLIGLARGDVAGLSAPDDMGTAVAEAFATETVPARFEPLLAGKRLGEAILIAIGDVTEGAKGDLRDVTDGLALLRSVGLEDSARRAALQLLLLERRG